MNPRFPDIPADTVEAEGQGLRLRLLCASLCYGNGPRVSDVVAGCGGCRAPSHNSSAEMQIARQRPKLHSL